MNYLILCMALLSSTASACSQDFDLFSLPCNMDDHDKFWYAQTLILQVVDYSVSKGIRDAEPYYEEGCMKSCKLHEIKENNPWTKRCAGTKPKSENLMACMLVAAGAFHWLQYQLDSTERTVFNIGHTFLRFDVINGNVKIGLKARW